MHKNQLLKEIQQLDFALQECTLFLDLHPNHEEALCQYRNLKKELINSTREYEKNYTTFCNRSVYTNDYNAYASDPWPWENKKGEC